MSNMLAHITVLPGQWVLLKFTNSISDSVRILHSIRLDDMQGKQRHPPVAGATLASSWAGARFPREKSAHVGALPDHGMRYLGCTCYAAAFVQDSLHCPAFAQAPPSAGASPIVQPVAVALQQILAAMARPGKATRLSSTGRDLP